ncbi:DNA-binding response regulator [Pedobacter yulinensis]|uniref:DNA-binding response regulator n=1 Tax=Pedobacter yulinensis TaxID=2126353 RepID=A0A2T3HK24_9SPHI|nr:response regulator transcription factor [Pedobacter yulinensis]PST82792.1 DNA-binding response regulator [Pedobacter yulinensis]
MIKILLAEDHLVVREGLKALIDEIDDFEVIGEASNGHEAISLLDAGCQADLLLTDLYMPGMNGIDLSRSASERYPRLKIIFLSMLDTEQHLMDALRNGASGYLLKNSSVDELEFAIRHVFNGHRYVSAELTTHLIDRLLRGSFLNGNGTGEQIEFSERELEVLNMIGEGRTNSEMADSLFLSRRTVEGHRQSLLDKTGCRNTPSLIRFALQNGYLR